MNLARKTFKDNRTGQIIRVIDSFENIAILENKEKIDTRRLLDTNLYTEQINPSEFFESTNGAFDSIFEKIRNMPTENIPDDKGEIKPSMDDRFKPVEEESAVIYSSIDDEREELAKKYGLGINARESVVKQNESFAKIIGEDIVNELPLPYVQNVEEPIQRIEIDREERVETKSYVKEEKKEDPIINMFKGVKRSVEFSLDLKLENKIPRLDFIEMMEDSYEKSIIDFLATEFTNELLKDPKSLKDRISEKIREMVYKKTSVVKKPRKKPVKKNSRLDKTPLSKLEQDAKIIKRTIKKEAESHD